MDHPQNLDLVSVGIETIGGKEGVAREYDFANVRLQGRPSHAREGLQMLQLLQKADDDLLRFVIPDNGSVVIEDIVQITLRWIGQYDFWHGSPT